MSICRWSSDDYNCDLYIYESCFGGYEIHIAAKKADGSPIGLPCDGKDFHFDDPEDVLDLVLRLRDMGYSFPGYVIDYFTEEAVKGGKP